MFGLPPSEIYQLLGITYQVVGIIRSRLKHHESKTKLLDAAVRVFRSKGYSATSVDDVCRAAELTKGSFFYHFKSKEELAVGAAEHFAAMASRLFTAAPYRTLADPLDRVLGYVEFRASMLHGTPSEFTCLLGTMVQEAHETHPAIRAACEREICAHAADVAADIELAKQKYAPHSAWTAQSLGLHVQAVLQGSFVLAKAKGGPDAAADCVEHLQRYLEMLFTPSREGVRS